jgi:hypothetical protein
MVGVRAVVELSAYHFEVLRKDDAFVLYRGRNGENASQVLMLSPATMGELVTSIVHEVSQPLTVTNANAALRFLTGDSPNLTETEGFATHYPRWKSRW